MQSNMSIHRNLIQFVCCVIAVVVQALPTPAFADHASCVDGCINDWYPKIQACTATVLADRDVCSATNTSDYDTLNADNAARHNQCYADYVAGFDPCTGDRAIRDATCNQQYTACIQGLPALFPNDPWGEIGGMVGCMLVENKCLNDSIVVFNLCATARYTDMMACNTDSETQADLAEAIAQAKFTECIKNANKKYADCNRKANEEKLACATACPPDGHGAHDVPPPGHDTPPPPPVGHDAPSPGHGA